MAYKEIKVSRSLVEESLRVGKTLSQRLEEMDPTSEYKDELSKIDAFDRQLLKHNVYPYSVPEAGIHSSKMEAFFQAPDPELKTLFPEYIERAIRDAKQKDSVLPYLLANTKSIQGNSYRATYVDDNKIAQSKRRVPVGAPLPKVVLKPREQAVTIYKHGIAIEAPYETIRWMSLDEFNLFIRREMKQAALDEADGAIDTLLNGDGNPNTAAKVIKITATGIGGTKGSLDYKSWLIWSAKFRPYQLTTVIGGEEEIVDFLTMDFPNVDPLKVVSLLKADKATSIDVRVAPNVYSSLMLVFSDRTDLTGKLLCLDRGFALQRLVEVGSTIRENAKFIENQTELLTLSENSGFNSVFADAAKVLEYSWT